MWFIWTNKKMFYFSFSGGSIGHGRIYLCLESFIFKWNSSRNGKTIIHLLDKIKSPINSTHDLEPNVSPPCLLIGIREWNDWYPWKFISCLVASVNQLSEKHKMSNSTWRTLSNAINSSWCAYRDLILQWIMFKSFTFVTKFSLSLSIG